MRVAEFFRYSAQHSQNCHVARRETSVPSPQNICALSAASLNPGRYIYIIYIYVTVFAKRDHLEANLDFEFCIRRESTFDELPVALYCASLAGSVSEIHSLKVQNYEHSVFKKMAFKHLLPVNPAFCRVNEVIAKHGRTSRFASV